MPSPGLDLMPGFIPARKIQKPKKNLNQYFFLYIFGRYSGSNKGTVLRKMLITVKTSKTNYADQHGRSQL